MGVLFSTLIAVIALLIVSSVGCLPESGRSGYAEPTFRHSRADNGGKYYGDRPGLRVPKDALIPPVDPVVHATIEDEYSDTGPMN
jgi:hypothetical protein